MTYLFHTFFITTLACCIERLFGYPHILFRYIKHPVVWIGAIISFFEKKLNKPEQSQALAYFFGILLIFFLSSLIFIITFLSSIVLNHTLPPFLGDVTLAFLLSSLIAQRSLWDHVKAVQDALNLNGLKGGRQAVSMIVGRDPNTLDEAGVIRASIESLAENFSDGIVAPILWALFVGLPGASTYKTINTADSMIGHLTPRYRAFGWASAKLDDLVNIPASRLSALWIIAAAATLPQTSAQNALQTVLKDARHHRSPNAGWPEAAMAGALGIKLAGPRSYNNILVDDHWIGSGNSFVKISDLKHALQLYKRACFLQILTIASLTLLFAFMLWG
ncbi:adenosylcobinamide-phosphate synthase CbiB [Swingsia samuiensis]|uniref:Cobalamin biosynthesis protein CobD n=1 Tax=Swingsia samuiensis TaxID=1293412 RepID=A0A4Y6UN03_9PROT|nr:adenosylcobinamide-phosphate synthase CbiB [Swingsia samuiensis]QDH17761.1 cobalamin biosynthesis protein CobD [Swingsia samuiensis]